MERKRKLDITGLGQEQTQGSATRAANVNPLTGAPYSQRYRTLFETRKQLPVWGYLEKVDAMLRANRVIVLEGETGSGKTTQVRGARWHAPRCAREWHTAPRVDVSH